MSDRGKEVSEKRKAEENRVRGGTPCLGQQFFIHSNMTEGSPPAGNSCLAPLTEGAEAIFLRTPPRKDTPRQTVSTIAPTHPRAARPPGGAGGKAGTGSASWSTTTSSFLHPQMRSREKRVPTAGAGSPLLCTPSSELPR